MLKFEFLGVNNSLQEKDNCNTSLLIKSEQATILIDTSGNVAEAVNSDIDAVLITHEHIDHIYALPSLLHQLWLLKRSRHLTIYCHENMVLMLEKLIDVFKIRDKKNIFTISFEPVDNFHVRDIGVNSVISNHTNMSRSYVFTCANAKLVYTSDTRPFLEVPTAFWGANTLIHEAAGTLREQNSIIQAGHSPAESAAYLADKIGVNQLILCHLPVGMNAKQEIVTTARCAFSKSLLAKPYHWYCV